MIKSVALISFDQMGKVLEPFTSYEDVTTIAIKYYATHQYNVHHTIVPSVDPKKVGIHGPSDFYLNTNPENATREIEQLKNALIGVDLVIVLVELEEYYRNSTTFTLLQFIKHIQALCSKIVCVAKEPFWFMGSKRRLYSDRCLTQLLEEHIPVITIDNNKLLIAKLLELGWDDITTVTNSMVTTITCDLIKRLRETQGWEDLLEIVQKSSSSQIYFDITKKSPEPNFFYTIFGRCNAPALIDWFPIEINIPVKEQIEEPEKVPPKTVLSWIMSLFWR